MYQRDWDEQKQKAKFWVNATSSAFCIIIMLVACGTVFWAASSAFPVINAAGEVEKEVRSAAISRLVIALVVLIVTVTLWDLSRSLEDKINWWVAKRLGDHPTADDHKEDDYELLEVSSYYAPGKALIASVNGWSFLVTKMANKKKHGTHTMDFGFEEIGTLKDKKSRLTFGSSAMMYDEDEVSQDELLCEILSKMAHKYPELKNPPDTGRYV